MLPEQNAAPPSPDWHTSSLAGVASAGPQAPKHIEIGESTGQAFKDASQQPNAEAEVDLLVGCKTVKATPR